MEGVWEREGNEHSGFKTEIREEGVGDGKRQNRRRGEGGRL